MKQKTSRNLNFWVSAAVFQPELNNLQKRLKYVKKCHFWEGFSKLIQLKSDLKKMIHSISWVSAAAFQPELNNLQKRPKYVKKCHFCDGFLKFIQL